MVLLVETYVLPLVAESGKVRVDGYLENKALRCCLRI
jgi:hypothetical protein